MEIPSIPIGIRSQIGMRLLRMGKFIDMSGKTVNGIQFVNRAPNKGKVICWNCVCHCGSKFVGRAADIRHGSLKSCGCLKYVGKLSHGLSYHPIYRSYQAMMHRCYNENNIAYHNYGGRGVEVCERWKGQVGNFIADMYPTYSEGLTLDRIDVNGNYSPDNCRWSTAKEQGNNTRLNNRIEWNGENLTLSEWADRLGVGVTTLHNRQKAGWSNERIITEPLHNAGRNAKRYAAKRL